MARSRSVDETPEFPDNGTYSVPGVGLVLNGSLLDGHDLDAVAAYHAVAAREAEQVDVDEPATSDDTEPPVDVPADLGANDGGEGSL